MIANDVMYKVRLYIGDTDKSKMSDWEIINGINDDLRHGEDISISDL